MPIKHADFIIKGMHRDLSESVFNPEFAYENQNLRITAEPNSGGSYTGDMYALTNEKGNKYVSISGLNETGHNEFGKSGDMKGCPIGQCLINNQWVVFTTEIPEEIFIEGEEKEIEDFPIEETVVNNIKVDTLDRIYRLWHNGNILSGELLYEGHLNFDYNSPIEALPSYENEEIQKVYWTDGLNQPRFINIVENEEKRNKWNDTSFDFVSTLALEETVHIERNVGIGTFPAGVIQYCFTYSNLFGVETNIFYISQLYDIIQDNRGLAPDEKTKLTFKIKIDNLDTKFSYINIYSIIRTSLDNIPITKLISKQQIISDTITFYDINIGETIEPQSLFYKGGNEISAYTIEGKDNTLFLGNYSLKQSYIPNNIRKELRSYCSGLPTNSNEFNRCLISDLSNSNIKWDDLQVWDGVITSDDTPEDTSEYDNLIKKIGYNKFFKSQFGNNYYRLGLQFQHYTGRWSEVVWIGDYKAENYINIDSPQGIYNKSVFRLIIRRKNLIQSIIDYGYRKIRPVICYPKQSDKVFICEGVLSPSVYTCKEESMNKFYPSPMIHVPMNHGVNELKTVGMFANVPDEKFNSSSLSEQSPIRSMVISTNWGAGNHQTWGLKVAYSKNVMSLFTYDTLDYNSEIMTMNFKNCKLRISDSDLSAYTEKVKKELYLKEITHFHNGYLRHPDDDKGYVPSSLKGYGLIKTFNKSYHGGHYGSGWVFVDYFANPAMQHDDNLNIDRPTKEALEVDSKLWVYYPISIWQHSGSINFDLSGKTSVLKSNKTLNTFRFNTSARIYHEIKPKNMQVWTNGIIGEDVSSGVLLYDGNVSLLQSDTGIYPRVGILKKSIAGRDDVDYADKDIMYSNYDDYKDYTELYSYFKPEGENDSEYGDKVYAVGARNGYNFTQEIKYKTPPHLVIFGNKLQTFNNDNNNPQIVNTPLDGNYNIYSKCCAVIQDVDETIYSGRDTEVNETDNYCVGGVSEIIFDKIKNDNNEYEYKAKDEIKIYFTNGDLYRIDSSFLRTFAYTLEDENNYIEGWETSMFSYMNPYCRYDRNVRNVNFGSNMSNFWLINNVYNQKDNFMVYHELDLSKNSINNFPNSFTWTLTKWAGDEVDKWTQITLANTMDVDGSKGNITKILKFQDQLLCFQPNQLSQILYNEREQIATGSGVPIELSNSGKVNGVRPVTVLSGCNNKWSITKSEKSLYWIDDENKQICAFNGQVMNLSDSLGFHSWINDKSTLYRWNPIDFNSFVSYFDPYNENIMFIYNNNTLSYSEQLNCFDTFLPYRNVPYYMAFNKSAFMLSNRDINGKFGDYKVWEMFKGDYNYFFVHNNCTYMEKMPDIVRLKGRYDKNNNPTNFGYEPYWTTLLVNPDMSYDKVFNNIDMRTDMWNNNNELLEETFSHLEVWNEFQWNKSNLVRNVDIPKVHLPAQHSILKKKFRVWYVNIPRDIKQSNPRLRYYNRDRMRNTWLYLKLSKELIDNDGLITYPYISDNKHIIHHIGVSYFV